MPTTIYLPESEARPDREGLAPSPASLAGLRIAVLDNGKPNAGVVMARAAESLAAATGARVSLVTKKGPGGRSANAAIPCAPDTFDLVVREADVVLTGAADCGSCTAYSVYDAIALERAGRPAVVVTTTQFRPVAETMARDFGLPETRLLVLPHPLGATDRPTLHRWADEAVGRLAAVLTGGAAPADGPAQPTGGDPDPAGASAGGIAPPAPTSPPVGGFPGGAGAADDLAEGLAQLRDLVRPDGSDLVLVGVDRSSGAVWLRLVVEDASCADCVMPRELLEGIALDRLAPAGWVTRVAVDDPREQP